jgi:hypothetical protein
MRNDDKTRANDVARGQLVAVSDKSITLDTWFGGIMNFDRLKVAKIEIENSAVTQYHGPSSLNGWTVTPDAKAWVYRDFAFISSGRGSIASGEILPDECSIKFDAQWKDSKVNLSLFLFSNKPSSPTPESGYEISLQHSAIYLRNGSNHNFIGSSHSQELGDADHIQVEIRASKKTGEINMWINDRKLETWRDPNLNQSVFGSCLHFISANNTPIRISNITIAQWDSKAERFSAPENEDEDDLIPKPKPVDETENTTESYMKLANGDSIIGEVTSIHDGIVGINSTLGEFELPINRFSSLNLKNLGSETAKRLVGDIRAVFADGSSLVFRLDSVDGDTVTGTSQHFGTTQFKLSTISRIEFDIHNRNYQEMRSRINW